MPKRDPKNRRPVVYASPIWMWISFKRANPWLNLPENDALKKEWRRHILAGPRK